MRQTSFNAVMLSQELDKTLSEKVAAVFRDPEVMDIMDRLHTEEGFSIDEVQGRVYNSLTNVISDIWEDSPQHQAASYSRASRQVPVH